MGRVPTKHVFVVSRSAGDSCIEPSSEDGFVDRSSLARCVRRPMSFSFRAFMTMLAFGGRRGDGCRPAGGVLGSWWASPAGRSSRRHPITSGDGGSTRDRRSGGTSPGPWEGCGSFRATDAPAGDVGAPWTPGRLSLDTHRLTIISCVCNSSESGRPTSLVLRHWQTIGCCVRAGIGLRPDARTRHR